MIGQNIRGKNGAVVGVLGGEEGVQEFPACIDAVVIESRGWTGESREARSIQSHARTFVGG